MMSSDGRSYGLLVDLPHESVAGSSRHPSQRLALVVLFGAIVDGLRRLFA